MKINILADLTDKPYGGGNQFLKALKNIFVKKGIYSANPDDADIILFNSYPFDNEFLFKLAYFLKKKKKILIHRIDGPIFKIREKDFEIDRTIYYFNEILSDGTIFQSEWSKKENYSLGIKKNQYETVIRNAPNKDIFNNKNRIIFNKNRKIRLIAISWSSNWNKGFEVYKYMDNFLDFSKYEMTFIGNSPIKFKNIKRIKPLRSDQLSEYLKNHDIYITASKKDPCSNSLIEALNCGLPALVLNDGGHPELMNNAGEMFNTKEQIIPKLEKIVDNYDFYQSKIKFNDIKKIADEYLDFFKLIYNDYRNGEYMIKTTSYLKFLKFKTIILLWKIEKNGLLKLLNFYISKRVKFIFYKFKRSLKSLKKH